MSTRLGARMPARHPKVRRMRWRAPFAAFAAVAVVLSGNLVASLPAASAAPGQVSGLVYLDFNADGTFDSGNLASSGIANDIPYAGVTVTAYDGRGNAVGTAVSSDASGENYAITLDSGVDATAPLRIEFTLPDGSYDAFHGASSATSVRFVTAGAENVDFGVVRPGHYNQGDPYIATVLQFPGLHTGVNADEPAVVLTPWSVERNAFNEYSNLENLDEPSPSDAQVESPNCTVHERNCADFSERITLATIAEVGSVYSTAFDEATGDLYVAASYKRGAALGPLGLGGIYRFPGVIDASGALAAPLPGAEQWLDVRDVGTKIGTALDNTSRGVSGLRVPDPDAFAKANKVGIGGMAIDSTRGLLYFVNLNDANVYAIDLDDKSSRGSWATPATPAASAAFTQRAFALTLRDDALYLGYNDTGEAYPFCPASSPGSTYIGDENGACTGSESSPMSAFVARAHLDVTGAPGVWEQVLNIPLNYAKGNNANGWQDQGSVVAEDHPQVLRWNTWVDTWDAQPDGVMRSVSFNTCCEWDSNDLHIYPQPFVASLSFDAAGYLTIGLGDRTQTQNGSRQIAANGDAEDANEATFETIASGDTLIAAPNGTGYTLENNGSVTGRTSSHGIGSSEGPGGGEFYNDRGNLGRQDNHYEASLGATVVAPGVDQVASTFIDPLNPVRVSGLGWFDAADGSMARGYQMQNDPGGDPYSSTFQKGGGIGGLSLLLAEAPVEIGNRVWYDIDGNGIQDPDEPAIGGAIVELWLDADGDGEPDESGRLATATTTGATAQGTTVYGATTVNYSGTAPGTFYFRTDDAAAAGVPAFTKNADYVLVFRPPYNPDEEVALAWPETMSEPEGFAGLAWPQMRLTTQTAVGATEVNDSNPHQVTEDDLVKGYAPVTVGAAGESDHTIDAGWTGTSGFRIQKTVTGWDAVGATEFTITVADATDFRGEQLDVDDLSFVVTAGEVTQVTEQFPYGTTLTFAEEGATASSVEFTGNPSTGASLLISPTDAEGGHLLQVENRFTTITVQKALSGDVVLPQGTTFPIKYRIGDGPILDAEVGTDATLTIAGVPYGQTVHLHEPLPGPFTWGGYIWATGTWTQGDNALAADAEGWVTITASESNTTTALTLTNHPYVPPALPFTGGLATDLFTIAGGVVLLVGLGLGVWHFRMRTRRIPAHRA